jgi:gliding motility-associated-like protein/uncharacterized repeat protein (TIGR01451 family)
VQNYGDVDLNNIQVTDDLTAALPLPITFVKSSLTTSNVTSGSALAVNAGFNGSTNKNLLNVASSNLKIGASGTITLVITVTIHSTYGTFNNTATATGISTDGSATTVTDVSDNNASPNEGDVTKTPLDFNAPTPITFAPPDIQVTKTVDNPTANVGSNVTFTILVKNIGAGGGAPLVFTDLLPAGFAYISSTHPGLPPSATYTNTTGIWAVGIVGPGVTRTLTITATVLPNHTPSEYINTASVTATDDTDLSNNTASAAVTLNITLSPATLPNVSSPLLYTQTISASGGNAPYSFAVTSGALPAGITLAPNGTLSGTATQLGTFNFSITATDAYSFTGSQAYTLTVNGPTLTLSPATFPAATVGTSYSQTLSTSRNVVIGGETYTYAVTAGALPAGLSLTSAGSLSGTPTAGGTFNFTITSTDNATGAGPYTGSQAYTLTVNAPTITLAPATLTASTVGTAYSQTIAASNGTALYTYAVTAGSLPAGLVLSTTGTLSGIPTAGGSFNFTVTATDASTGSGPYSGSQVYTLTVNTPTITLAPATLPASTVGTAYSQPIAASNGTAPYTYAATAGALPAGLVLSTTGTLSGIPTAGGSFNFTVTATDASTGAGPYTRSQVYTLTVNAPTITLAPATLPAATTGIVYSQAITAIGGTAPYRYAVTAGALPAGLSLTSAGLLSGAPTAGGTFNFTITSTDNTTGSGPYTGSQAYTLTVNAPTITLAPATLQAATVSTAYSQSITASGGTAPYTYGVTTGTLPAGLVLSSTGNISGIPTAGGSFNFTVTATDASTGSGPYTGSAAYNITAGKANQTIAFADSTATYCDAPITLTGTASSGLGVTYTSSNPSVASVSGSTLTILSVGTATITASQAGNLNYNAATGVAKTLTVNAKALTVTAADKSKTYGTTDPTLTYQVTLGSLVGTDTFAGALTRNPGEAANTYAIKQGTLALNANYIITYIGANLTISKAALTVKANDQTRPYNAANPIFTVSYRGFYNGDTEASLTTNPIVSTTATASSPVGTYPLTVAGAASPNYIINYSPGTLTVTQAVLTVTADNKSRKYGDANPLFSVTYNGFLNGDDARKLTTVPVAANNSAATTAPGNYPITVSGGASADYIFNYVPGTLTIAPLTNAGLSSLTTNPGSLSPIFNTNTFIYNVAVDNATANLTLTAIFDVTSSGTVNGTAVPNGSPSFGVPLNVGNNVITLIVTAQDGVTKKTYTLNVYRGITLTSITSNNILTPDGDSKNDYWIVKDIQLYPNNTVAVYDSGGRQVFAKKGYNNDWAGTLNGTGSPLAAGTYYYMVNLGVGGNVIKGYISIIKSK